jgi:hypothetical protein
MEENIGYLDLQQRGWHDNKHGSEKNWLRILHVENEDSKTVL